MFIKNCIKCGKSFKKQPYESKKYWELKKYCSRNCSTLWTIGNIPWNKGKERSEFDNEGNPNWKGDEVGYSGIHRWIKRHLGNPKQCTHCGLKGRYKKIIRLGKVKNVWTIEWANVSRQYLRNFIDWIGLCHPCHVKYDDILKKAWITRKMQKEIYFERR